MVIDCSMQFCSETLLISVAFLLYNKFNSSDQSEIC